MLRFIPKHMPLMGEHTLIAIVDDDASVRRALARLVRAGGYAAACFASGDEFLLSMNGSDAPACMLLDVHMPGSSGFDVLDALAKMKAQTAVIVITASQEPDTTARAIGLGAVECLVKPVDGPVLLEAIRVALERQTAAPAPRNGMYLDA
jgi:FixJ family two-component response regulator